MKTLHDWALLALASIILCLFLPIFREPPEEDEESGI